jgi:DNA repair protein RadC
LLGVYCVSKGGVAGTVVDPKLIFAAALKANSTSMILCHNHPSGNLQPSQSDVSLTKKLVQAGEFMELKVVDHIIMTTERYFSFADEGMI